MNEAREMITKKVNLKGKIRDFIFQSTETYHFQEQYNNNYHY